MFKVIIIGVVLTIAAMFTMGKVSEVINPPGGGNNSQLVSEAPGTLVKVTITGAVSHIGEYKIEATKTIGDLIFKAGGLRKDADVNSFFENETIGSIREFYISSIGELPPDCVIEGTKKVNLNTADEVGIATIDAIGPKLAQAIVKYREEHGEFRHLETLLEVPGIGSATFAKIRDKFVLK